MGCAFPVHAQDDNSAKGEAAAFIGTQHLPGTTNPTFGGSIGVNFGSRFLLFAEPSYVPQGGGDHIINLLGGIDYSFPTPVKKLVPFFDVVGGLGRSPLDGNATTFGAGFGTRYFLGDRWGIKPEFRWQRYQQVAGGSNAYLFRFGVFYQFGTR